MTQNSFGRLRSVVVGSLPPIPYLKSQFQRQEDSRPAVWSLYSRIVTEYQQDLDEMATLYRDLGVEVHRPCYDPVVCDRWHEWQFRAVTSVTNRFFAYRDQLFYTNTQDDRLLAHHAFLGRVLSDQHDLGRQVLVSPMSLEDSESLATQESQWPTESGFKLDGPCFIPAEHTVFHNSRHCNNARGIQWIQRQIQLRYPDTRLVDVSDLFTNHMDNQLRIYNPNLAHVTRSEALGPMTQLLEAIYPGIEVMDFSHHQARVRDLRQRINTENGRTLEWLRYWADTDIEHGDVQSDSISVDGRTVIMSGTSPAREDLESRGLRVETVRLRHNMLFGSGVSCETAVLSRDPQ